MINKKLSMGTGKSYTALEIARLISIYIAERMGDKPEDHFTMENHVGIMVMDEIAKIYEHMDSHMRNIYIIDD
jgi:hypothetical protein